MATKACPAPVPHLSRTKSKFDAMTENIIRRKRTYEQNKIDYQNNKLIRKTKRMSAPLIALEKKADVVVDVVMNLIHRAGEHEAIDYFKWDNALDNNIKILFDLEHMHKKHIGLHWHDVESSCTSPIVEYGETFFDLKFDELVHVISGIESLLKFAYQLKNQHTDVSKGRTNTLNLLRRAKIKRDAVSNSRALSIGSVSSSGEFGDYEFFAEPPIHTAQAIAIPSVLTAHAIVQDTASTLPPVVSQVTQPVVDVPPTTHVDVVTVSESFSSSASSSTHESVPTTPSNKKARRGFWSFGTRGDEEDDDVSF